MPLDLKKAYLKKFYLRTEGIKRQLYFEELGRRTLKLLNRYKKKDSKYQDIKVDGLFVDLPLETIKALLLVIAEDKKMDYSVIYSQ